MRLRRRKWTAPNGCTPGLPWCDLPDAAELAWPFDIERTGAPDPLEERAVLRLRQTKRYASRVREAHFPGIDRRMLCLLGVGTLQQESGRACVPEVSAGEHSAKLRALYVIQVKYG